MTQMVVRGLIVAGLFLPILPAPARAAETRDMTIQVDGKKAGESHVTVDPQKDGSTIVSTTADVAVPVLILRYTYTYSGTEVWKDGKLQKLDSKTNDNGKKFTVKALADKDGLNVNTAKTSRAVGADIWTSSYYRYPDLTQCDKTIPLLDSDTGKELAVKLKLVGKEEIVVAGQKTACTHFSLTGGLTAELWYDGEKKLVRQELVESGHKMLMELTGVHK
jgi:hypothetical protein